MKFKDYMKYAGRLFVQNQKRNIICVVVSFFLSLLILGCLYIGFTYYFGMTDAENTYLHKKNLVIYVYDSKERTIEYGKIYHASKVEAESYFAMYVDLDKETELNLLEGTFPASSHELLADREHGLSLGETLEENGITYRISGIYSSDTLEGFVGSIYFLDEVQVNGISLIYTGDEKRSAENIISLGKKLESEEISFDTSDYDVFVSFHNSGSLVVCFSIVLSAVLFAASIGFFSNAFSMALDQSRKLLTMLHVLGLEKRKITALEFLYGISLAGGGLISAYLIMWCFSSVIKLDDIYSGFMPSQFKSVLTDYAFTNNFPWYIVFINLLFYMIAVIILCLKNNKHLLSGMTELSRG